MNNLLSENLKKLRKISGYTQEEVAELINVSRQAVAKWENTDTVPDMNNCLALAKLYKTSLNELVSTPNESTGEQSQPKGKHIFGLVRVGERGQIVIPEKARKIFGIMPGDSLLMLGDEAQGIAIISGESMEAFARDVINAKHIEEEENNESR